jgi:hypothetical protein
MTLKTTAYGILTIVGAVAISVASYLKTGAIPDVGSLLTTVTGALMGMGLIKAADAPTTTTK